MKVRHFKNIKPAIPPIWFPTKHKEFTIYFIPRESTKYIQPNVYEQEDWLKSLGLSYSPIFNGHKNSIMLGWRYNPSTQLFEFGPYWHDHDKEAHYPEKDNVSSLFGKVNEPIKMIIKKVNLPLSTMVVSLTNLISNEEVKYTLFIQTSKWARTISPWFGGTLPPPSNVCYDLYWNLTDEEVLNLI